MPSLLIWILTLSDTFSQVLALPGTQTRFSQEPADQTVVAGQRAVLPCVLLNYSGIVQWTKDGLALGMGQGLKAWPRYRVVGSADAGQYNLEITDAELSDDASYECQATEAALRSRRAKLTVLIPPEDTRIDGGPVILLQAGTPHNLTCRAFNAKPAANIIWFRDGTQQEGAVATTELLKDGKRETTISQLLIHPTDLDIGRVFTCRSMNEAIPNGKETSIELDVHHPPTVTLSIEPQTVQEGERVIFTCQATANPEILGYRWAKGGFLIEDAHESRYETNVDYSFFTEPVSCEVYNKVGSTNVSTLVNVHFAPRIVVDPKPTTTDIGSDVTLTCVWVGNPPLTLTWTKKDSNMVNLSLPVLNAGRKGHGHPGAVKTMGGVKLAFSDQNWNISRVLGFGREHVQSAVLILGLCIELRVKRVKGAGGVVAVIKDSCMVHREVVKLVKKVEVHKSKDPY